MKKFPKLQALLPTIEDAETMFEVHTGRSYDEARYRDAIASFNRVLSQAADAIVADDPDEGVRYLEEWRPKAKDDTWFGPEPVKFLLHILRNGAIPHASLPDESALR